MRLGENVSPVTQTVRISRELDVQEGINGHLTKDLVNVLTKVVGLVCISAQSPLHGLDAKQTGFDIMITKISQEYVRAQK